MAPGPQHVLTLSEEESQALQLLLTQYEDFHAALPAVRDRLQLITDADKFSYQSDEHGNALDGNGEKIHGERYCLLCCTQIHLTTCCRYSELKWAGQTRSASFKALPDFQEVDASPGHSDGKARQATH